MKAIKNILLFAAALSLFSCANKQSIKTSFTLTVNEVNATKLRYTVEVSNPNAFYSIGFLSEDMHYYKMSELDFAKFQIGFFQERVDIIRQEGDPTATVTNHFCMKGNYSGREFYLKEQTNYKIIVFQVDPNTQSVVEDNIVTTYVKTKELPKTDITFDIKFAADQVTIVPSNNDGYFWMYDKTENIKKKYGDINLFYNDYVFMYEEYDFMSHLIKHGKTTYVFSELDTLVEGEKYTLAYSGYTGTDVNTDIGQVSFIYHKDSPIEVIDEDLPTPPVQT